MRYGSAMLTSVRDFQKACEEAGVEPPEALVAGGVHRSLWYRWARGKSPTLSTLERAQAGLAKLKDRAA